MNIIIINHSHTSFFTGLQSACIPYGNPASQYNLLNFTPAAAEATVSAPLSCRWEKVGETGESEKEAAMLASVARGRIIFSPRDGASVRRASFTPPRSIFAQTLP